MQTITLFFLICGVFFVAGTPFYPDSPLDLVKLKESNEFQHQHDLSSNIPTASSLNFNKTSEIANPAHNIPVIQEALVESTIIIEIPSNHYNNGGKRHEAGPVEMGLRNVVSSSGIAAEELFIEMAGISSDIFKQFNAKSELLTAQAMNEIFKSLSAAENEIKKNQECGKQFVDPLNSILGQINTNLKACTHNLTVIGESFKNQSTQILSAMSKVSDEIQNLPESCDIAKDFAVGTFCVVNNLAETNVRALMILKDMNFAMDSAKKSFSRESSSTQACHKRLVNAVHEKLKILFKEMGEKCNYNQQQNKPQNNEF